MKKILVYVLLTALLLGFSWGAASESISHDVTAGIVRLHILANSNTSKDQALKYKLRNRLLHAVKYSPKRLTDKEIEKLCTDELLKNGSSQSVKVSRGFFPFPRKKYENITLPAGTYYAVSISIGEGTGQNWWCVMYPPLCFSGSIDGHPDARSLALLKSKLTPESFDMIFRSDSPVIKPSFKLVEIWNDLKERIKQ